MPSNLPRWNCPECSLSQRVTGSGKIVTHYHNSLDKKPCPGSGQPAHTAPGGEEPATSFFFLATGMTSGAAEQLRGRMAPRSRVPTLVVEAVDAHRGEIVTAELTVDLAGEWDGELDRWARWGASPAVQAAHRLALAAPVTGDAEHVAPHVPSAPEVADVHDARGTRLAGLTPHPRTTPILAVGIARTRRPTINTFVLLDLCQVHNVRAGLHTWLAWVEHLTRGGLQP